MRPEVGAACAADQPGSDRRQCRAAADLLLLTTDWKLLQFVLQAFLCEFIALTPHPWCHTFWCLIKDPAHIQKLFVCIGAHTDAKMFPSTIFSCQFHHSYYSDRHSVRASALCRKAKSCLKFFCSSNPDVLFPSSLLQLFKGIWISAEAVMSATSMVPPCWLHQEMSGRHLFWVLEQPQLSSVLNNSIVSVWSSLNCFSGRWGKRCPFFHNHQTGFQRDLKSSL